MPRSNLCSVCSVCDLIPKLTFKKAHKPKPKPKQQQQSSFIIIIMSRQLRL